VKLREFWRRLQCAWWALREESCDCPQQDALEVLCRVFDDDESHDEWLEWYEPADWLSPSRALGAFIYLRLKRLKETHEDR
jgi:hypothetical protein